MLLAHPFDIEKHIFRSPQLQELMLDALRFFNGTPVHNLPPATKFGGSGVYAIYYTGDFPLYQKVSASNRTSYSLPIYVGKAIPSGGRKGLKKSADNEDSLHKRLREHTTSIHQAITHAKKNEAEHHLSLSDFACRFVIVPGDESAIIAPIESALIKQYQPLWNAAVDGFGNHTPGNGRFEQARSQWDTLHEGRPWAEKCKGTPPSLESIFADITSHLQKLDSLTSDEVS